ncbi:RNA-Hypothetical protein protein [Nesidiocoris tenuis]|uniref:RNA-binding protein 8A n=1 Tax=Nesidiocoris tenuis TaxID=355587 RepID=A0ABN7AWU0_9HEMI|nr:RNA-Hypothetical protein protein [Nesidiocoris tenuis]
MADVLDLAQSEEMESQQDEELDDSMDEGAVNVALLKEKANKRKGRGFSVERKGLEDMGEFESIDRGSYSDEPGPQRSIEGWILFITSLHEETQEDDIFDKLSEFGEIKNIHLNLDRRTGFLKGYALVEYSLYKQALAAKEAMDGTEILGQVVNVDWCFVTGPKKAHRNRSSSGRRRN